MNDIFEKHGLSDGRSIWVQRIKVRGVRKATWSVLVTGTGLLDAPEIIDVRDLNHGLTVLADILQADVCETI